MILSMLEVHPMTTGQLVQLGLFPSRRVAQRRLMTLAKKKKLKLCGNALLKRGRPEYVFCRHHIRQDNILHEIGLTTVLMNYLDGEIVRGHEVDNKLRPDAELTINGKKILIEYDMGTMDYRDIVQKRFKQYESFDGVVVWIAPSDTRKHGLMKRAEKIRHCALFTTVEAILAEPYGGVLVDLDGNIASIPVREGVR